MREQGGKAFQTLQWSHVPSIGEQTAYCYVKEFVPEFLRSFLRGDMESVQEINYSR
jgi:hypothetical protein